MIGAAAHKRILACSAIAGACLDAGCATPYQPLTAWTLRGGYVDEALTQDTLFVGFYGNGFTRTRDAGEYVLYRCAELADQAGAEYFVAIGGFPSGQSHEDFDVVMIGSIPSVVSVSRPFATVYVRLLRQPPNDPTQKVFKTKDVLESLRKKVRAS